MDLPVTRDTYIVTVVILTILFRFFFDIEYVVVLALVSIELYRNHMLGGCSGCALAIGRSGGDRFRRVVRELRRRVVLLASKVA